MMENEATLSYSDMVAKPSRQLLPQQPLFVSLVLSTWNSIDFNTLTETKAGLLKFVMIHGIVWMQTLPTCIQQYIRRASSSCMVLKTSIRSTPKSSRWQTDRQEDFIFFCHHARLSLSITLIASRAVTQYPLIWQRVLKNSFSAFSENKSFNSKIKRQHNLLQRKLEHLRKTQSLSSVPVSNNIKNNQATNDPNLNPEDSAEKWEADFLNPLVQLVVLTTFPTV